MRVRPSFLLVAALLASSPALALDVHVAGSWSIGLDAGDLIGGAGSDLVATLSSATSEVVLDVSATLGSSDAWRVDVRRADTTWDPDVHVWVRRTSSGTGDGTISGGASWVEVTASDVEFLIGEGDRSNVGLQIRLTGLSVGVAVDSYATTLLYTVVDT